LSQLPWLTARPIAHRGLHDSAAGVIENTASAFNTAIAGNYAIECDVQVSRDGEAMVHHDDALGRLTEGHEPLADLDATALRAVRFRATSDRILTLSELCALVGGRVPLLIELKSRFDGDMRLATRAAQVLGGYRGPAALMSFDPQMVAHLRKIAPDLPRGIVAERYYDDHDWRALPAAHRRSMEWLTHLPKTRPDFIAYWVKDLPALPPLVARYVWKLPLLAWTVRTSEERARARRWADQIIFEGFRP
jgi:glycerophosphoryl diester phosphodiesterase